MKMNLDWLKKLFDFVFPARCVLCHTLTHRSWSLCLSCEIQLPRITNPCLRCLVPYADNALCPDCFYHPPAYDRMVCPYLYQDPLPKFIYQLKLSSHLVYASILGTLLLQKIVDDTERQDLPLCLIPMPLHSQRIKQRGFNQCIEIARIISGALNIPINVDATQRIVATPMQRLLNRQQRKKNVADAFIVTGELPNHVAIIEDVVTTGATINEFAACLRKQGVKKIEVWCLARTERH